MQWIRLNELAGLPVELLYQPDHFSVLSASPCEAVHMALKRLLLGMYILDVLTDRATKMPQFLKYDIHLAAKAPWSCPTRRTLEYI
jgi:hypothetical protein